MSEVTRMWRFYVADCDVSREKMRRFEDDMDELVRLLIDDRMANDDCCYLFPNGPQPCGVNPVTIDWDCFHKDYTVHLEWLELVDLYHNEDGDLIDTDFVDVVLPDTKLIKRRMMMTAYDNTREKLENMNYPDLCDLFKRINENNGEFDDCIFYEWEELAELFNGYHDGASDMMSAMRQGMCNVDDDYFSYDGFSIDGYTDWEYQQTLDDNIDDLAEWLVEQFEINMSNLNSLDLSEELMVAIEADYKENKEEE